ncbi:uncharacterized protein LOC100678700 isoform X2 [Nasonia vitripennis]|nr:uncharacterized protein LOC100678700 isoform X2 [Nasonia vitripennis]
MPPKKIRSALTSPNQDSMATSENHNTVKLSDILKPRLGSNDTFESFEHCKKFLQNKALKRKEHELRELIKKRQQNSGQSTNLLKDQIKVLKRDIGDSKLIRKNICTHLATETVDGKLQCNTCAIYFDRIKTYKQKSRLINHILDFHFEELEKNNRPPSIRFNDNDSLISCHPRSPHSQINLLDDDDNPDDANLGDALVDGVDNSFSNRAAYLMPSRSDEISHTTVNDIHMFSRNSIEILKSIKWFDKESTTIRLALKNPDKLKKISDHRKKIQKNEKYKSISGTEVDDDPAMKDCYMRLIYAGQLNEIKHCLNKNPNAKSLCELCQVKVVEHTATVFAQSEKALKEQMEIMNNERLGKIERQKKLRESYKKDAYRLIRMRLENLRERRGQFRMLPELVRFNDKYYKMLEIAFNDRMLQEHIGLNVHGNEMFKFGELRLCGKLMDDLANQFLVIVTGTCMNSAHNQNRIMLTDKHIRQYKLNFVTTNKDATYFESFGPRLMNHIIEKYQNYLPGSKELEVIITDCLLRYSFPDDGSLYRDLKLEDFIFKHLKSPQPIFKFLMNMKFSRPYLTLLNSLLLRFLLKIAIAVLQLKNKTNSGYRVSYTELIEACEIVGVFKSSYTYCLKEAYDNYNRMLR